MKNKKLIMTLGAVVVVGILLAGIAMLGKDKENNTDDTQQIENSTETTSTEILTEQGTVNQLDWTILAQLDTYQDTLRTPLEQALNVKVNAETGEKTGQFYQKEDGTIVQNNTLKGVMENRFALIKFNHDPVIEAFKNSALSTYTDLEAEDDMTNFYMALNGYFNLLPDAEPSYANPNSILTRAEVMALIMRADTAVDNNLQIDANFEKVVGNSEYNIYAQAVDKDVYLSTLDSSLNSKTYTGTMSRAEVVFALVNRYCAEDFKNFDFENVYVQLEDAKDGGDIAQAQGFADKNYSKSYELVYALNNPDEGLPTNLYKALVYAANNGIIDANTRWDEGVTKAEAIEMLYQVMFDSAYDAMREATTNTDSTQTQNPSGNTNQEVVNKELQALIDAGLVEWTGSVDYGFETEEEFLQASADGVTGGTVVTTPTGESYVIWDSTGDIYYPGDIMPNGLQYGGNEIDLDKQAQEMHEALESIGHYDKLDSTEDSTEGETP